MGWKPTGFAAFHWQVLSFGRRDGDPDRTERMQDVNDLVTMFPEEWDMGRSILLLVALCACSATPGYREVATLDAGPDGHRYRVYRTADKVEVHRINRIYRPSLEGVLLGADMAIRTATGCRAARGSLKGDWAIIKARLDCG
jgi:hypothetical protein